MQQVRIVDYLSRDVNRGWGVTPSACDEVVNRSSTNTTAANGNLIHPPIPLSSSGPFFPDPVEDHSLLGNCRAVELATPAEMREIVRASLEFFHDAQFGLWLSLVERSPRVRK